MQMGRTTGSQAGIQESSRQPSSQSVVTASDKHLLLLVVVVAVVVLIVLLMLLFNISAPSHLWHGCSLQRNMQDP